MVLRILIKSRKSKTKNIRRKKEKNIIIAIIRIKIIFF